MRLSIQHLRKVYPDGKVALDDFNLELEAGVFGLLGPNGAGKSTLLEILSLNLMPSAGKVLWDGRDVQQRPREFRGLLGYLPQAYGFYGELRAHTFSNTWGGCTGFMGVTCAAASARCWSASTWPKSAAAASNPFQAA